MTLFKSSHYAAVLLIGVGLAVTPILAQTSGQALPQQTPASAEQGQVVEDIVAEVNDQIITQSDYNRAEQELEAEAEQQGLPPLETETRKKDLLRDLIDQQLLLSKGKDLGITGDTELVKELDKFRQQNHLASMEDLEKAVEAQGTSYEDFKAKIRDGIITQQVVQQEVGRRLDITQTDIENYYKAHESEFYKPESVTLQEILIGTPADANAAQVAAAESKANALEAQLKSGANFGDLAKADSSGPTAAEGGGLGEFTRGKLGTELENATFSLKPGQFTAPIRTKQGYLILLVNQHNPGGEISFDKAEPDVEQALYMERMEPKLREYLTTLRDGAAISIKPGYVDSGASPNEIQITNSAYVPPGPKKKKKFTRTRFRGRRRKPAATTQTASAAAAPAPAATATSAANSSAAKTKQETASIQKPGKREKIRFGQAPRESLPPASTDASSQTATAAPGDLNSGASAATPIEPIGSAAPAQAKPVKTRYSDRLKIRKSKQTKTAVDTDQPPPPTPDELATQKVQDAPLGLADQTAQTKKKQKGPKTRYSAKQTPPKPVQQPYMGPSQPEENPPAAQPAPPSAPSQPAGSQPSPAPSNGSPQ
jgi:peptidyl-prolyl cis-trans isomerase SurA